MAAWKLSYWFILKNVTNKATNLSTTVAPVNNFFTRWLKEIDMSKYPDDVRISPTNNTLPLADHAAAILKHLPNKALDKIKKTLLYSREPVYLTNQEDRRDNNENDATKRSDGNLNKRITDFHGQLGQKLYYRIPLKFFNELGAINTSHNIDTNFIFTLETNRNRLFEQNTKVDNIPDNLDAQVLFHDRPYIIYQQIVLGSNFQAFFNGTLRSKTALRNGFFLAPYQQTFEIAKGSQSQIIKFTSMPTQMEWMEISLVYDKSVQHTIVSDSYDCEIAAQKISNVKLEHVAQIYSVISTMEFNLTKEDDKHQMYKNVVGYVCSGCSAAPLTQYKNNDVYRDLIEEGSYFGTKSDEKLYLDLRRSRGYTNELEKLVRNDSGVSLMVTLKKAAEYKMRLCITTYSQAEYYYTMSSMGQIMVFKRYDVTKNSNLAGI